MTLDEAIKHAEEAAEAKEREAFWLWSSWLLSEEENLKYENYKKCAKEHRQLAEWLRELKHLRNLVAYSTDFHCTIEKAEKELRIAEDKIAYIESLNEEVNADADSD